MAERQLGEKLTEEDIDALVGQMIQDARNFIEEEFQDEREEATDMYYARPLGTEEEGRSQAIMTEVRDAARATIPSLLRVLTGPEDVVEFIPRGVEDADLARQKTAYVNYIFWEDNQGFRIIHATAKDLLIRKMGWVKWWWDDRVVEVEYESTGVSEGALAALIADDENEVEILDAQQAEEGALYDVRVVNRRVDGRCRVMAVPPEEMSWNQSARSVEDAVILVHSRKVRLDELLALGFDLEDIEGAVGEAGSTAEAEVEARRIGQSPEEGSKEARDPFTRQVMFHEAHVRLDIEGNGVSRLYRIPFVGEHTPKMIGAPEGISHMPFAFGVFDPEPHTLGGLSQADYTIDLQKINSEVLRGTLDSLALAIDPDTEVVDGEVNMADLLNTERGRIIRATRPGMMREVPHRFVGGDTLPFLEYMSQVKENRLGISKASAGLNADALQSSTRAAVAATVSGSQQHQEMLARIVVETLYADMFRGIYRTIVENQDRPREVRLLGQFVEVDPRGWEPMIDLKVNVALGAGPPEEQLAILKETAAKQEQILFQFGFNNPLVSLTQYRRTLALIIELSGRRNPDLFWKQVTPEVEQQLAQMDMEKQQQPQPPQDPAAAALAQAEMARVQVEFQKAQAEAQFRQQELELKREEMMLRDDRERDKQAADVFVALQKLQAESAVSLTREQIQAGVSEVRAVIDADARERVANIQANATERNDSE